MRKLFKNTEDGFTLVWLASMLVLLIGMAGFGTDLGWLYLNTIRAQTAVDAAALAGVINLPGFFDLAVIDAEDAVRANGFDPSGSDTLVLTPTAENQLHVSLQTQVEPFFLGVLGFDYFNVTREATGQYVKPVPLGSPDNCFGGGGLVQGCTGDTDFWGAVSGRMTKLEDGDPFSTLCNLTEWSGGVMSCISGNTNYARGTLGYNGYYFAVEVPLGAGDLQVFLYGGGFGGGQPGDGRYGADQGCCPNLDIDTTFTLYEPDITPLIPTDNNDVVCSMTDNQLLSNNWSQLCPSVGSPTPGIYVLHVESTNNSSGSNNYALRAETSGPEPRVYGINDMSIWSNDLSASSSLYIAEIVEEHVGKKLELSFFDAGDADDESWYYVNDPFGEVPDCTWKITDDVGNIVSEQTTPVLCQWQTQIPGGNPIPGTGNDGVYNKQWIIATIDLPDTQNAMCNAGDCFWTMDLDLANPRERTVWRARVIGNPVRLLP